MWSTEDIDKAFKLLELDSEDKRSKASLKNIRPQEKPEKPIRIINDTVTSIELTEKQ